MSKEYKYSRTIECGYIELTRNSTLKTYPCILIHKGVNDNVLNEMLKANHLSESEYDRAIVELNR